MSTPVLTHRNNQLYVDLAPLLEAGLEETFLTADVAAAGVTLTVKDIDGFAINQILVIGELGEETCEIVKTHASSAPSGVSITLVAGGVEFAHTAGTRVRRIQWNQIEWNHAATLTGAKSVLTTSDIQSDQLVQAYTDTTQTTGYYFARFKDAIGTTYSGYSDGVAYGGAAADTVGYMIEVALRENETRLGDNLSREDMYRWLNEGMRFIEGKQMHMPKGIMTGYNLDNTARGYCQHALPTDIYDGTTNQSIKDVRIGSQKLTYVDPAGYLDAVAGIPVTNVRTQAIAGDTSLLVYNSYDFDDSGTINIYKSGTKYTITYTGITRSALVGSFTGIPASGDGSITTTFAVDTAVWQNEVEGTPNIYSVDSGWLSYWPLPDTSHHDLNVQIDYWTVATSVDSDGDTIDINRYEMLLNYLTWRVRMKVKNNGKLDMTDGYYLMFKEKLNDAIRTSRSNFVHKMAPKLNRINYHN